MTACCAAQRVSSVLSRYGDAGERHADCCGNAYDSYFCAARVETPVRSDAFRTSRPVSSQSSFRGAAPKRSWGGIRPSAHVFADLSPPRRPRTLPCNAIGTTVLHIKSANRSVALKSHAQHLELSPVGANVTRVHFTITYQGNPQFLLPDACGQLG